MISETGYVGSYVALTSTGSINLLFDPASLADCADSFTRREDRLFSSLRWTLIGLVHSGPSAFLWGSHMLSFSLCSCNGIDSTPLQGWSCDSSLANQRVHPSDWSNWFRDGHLTNPDPTRQNIGINIMTLERKVCPLFCWIATRRMQAYSHS